MQAFGFVLEVIDHVFELETKVGHLLFFVFSFQLFDVDSNFFGVVDQFVGKFGLKSGIESTFQGKELGFFKAQTHAIDLPVGLFFIVHESALKLFHHVHFKRVQKVARQSRFGSVSGGAGENHK